MNTETLTLDQQQAVWNELAAEREGATADMPPPAVAKEEEPIPAAAAEPGTEPTAEPQPAAEAAATEPAKPDPLQELMAKIERLEGRQRNVEGHIGGLKDGQQRLLDTLTAAKSAAATVTDAPTQTQVTDAIKTPAKWEALKGEFPEWAEATEEFFQARIAALTPGQGFDAAEFERKLDERFTTVNQKLIDAQLNGVLPGWKKEVNTPAFQQWMQAQPDEVKALANSEDVDDATHMLSLYKAAKAADPTDRINAERKSKLAAAAATPKGVRVPQAKPISEMTPQELWDYEARQREKQRSDRGY